jgi:hypothetical protein
MSTNPIELTNDRINPTIIRWTKLEYAKRNALEQQSKLLVDFATVEDRDVRQLLAHVISIAGEYIKELVRQLDSDGGIAKPDYKGNLLKLSLDCDWWVDCLYFVYPVLREREQMMIDLLTAAASFFRETVDQ